MQSASSVMKAIKDLGWDKITLSTAKGFKGAAHEFTANGKSVAICFSMHEAFVVEDEAGLYNVDDLYSGIIKDSYFDVEDSGDIDGAKIVAFEQDGEVHFTDTFAELGIDTDEVKEDIKKRLLACATLDVMIDAPLG